jgi:ribonucleoside-diphosphate reductase alpha chain
MPATQRRERLPNRRRAETFQLEVAGLRYTATIGRFPDGRIGEIFLNNHKSNSAADTNARDSAIVCSIALQCGADIETIRRALCRDSRGRPSGPLGAALDRLCEEPSP